MFIALSASYRDEPVRVRDSLRSTPATNLPSAASVRGLAVGAEAEASPPQLRADIHFIGVLDDPAYLAGKGLRPKKIGVQWRRTHP